MFEKFQSKLPLTEAEQFTRHFKRMEVPARKVLLREGEVSQRTYWIEQGCIRAWFNNEGQDITFQFFFENSMVSSIESFRKGIASIMTLETIEPCVLWYADKADIEQIISGITQDPKLSATFIDVVFERAFDYMKHCLSYIKDSPQQRYLNLIEEKPQIIQRVPQHYIASYLGISKVHLSRIKSKLAKGKS